MKKIILLIITISICLCSCNEQIRTHTYGGDMTINLPAGQELMSATWEGNNLFYLKHHFFMNFFCFIVVINILLKI